MERLPEGCISHVFSLTSPRDSCRSAVVSATFRSATDSDTVWERFLPHDYPQILSRAVDPPLPFSTKKDLYFRLCDPILIDGGKRSFVLDRPTGGKCYTLCARELHIVWSEAPHYWSWIHHPDSRFPEVAELLNVCWLEIRGKIDCKLLTPRRTYAAYLLFQMAPTSHGFSYPEQDASVKVGAHESNRTVFLQPDEEGIQRRRRRTTNWLVLLEDQPSQETAESNLGTPHVRADGWMEMELGEFFNGEGDDGEVDISLKEVKGGQWKRGLIIEGIEVRPKN